MEEVRSQGMSIISSMGRTATIETSNDSRWNKVYWLGRASRSFPQPRTQQPHHHIFLRYIPNTSDQRGERCSSVVRTSAKEIVILAPTRWKRSRNRSNFENVLACEARSRGTWARHELGSTEPAQELKIFGGPFTSISFRADCF